MARKRVRKKGKNKNGILLISGMVIALCCIMLIGSIQLKQRINQYSVEAANLDSQIEEQEAYADDLVKESEYIQTQEYIEALAREKLGLVKDNEIIFKRQSK